MEADGSSLQDDRLSDNEPSPETIIAKTYHSAIETCQWQATKAVTKKFRQRDDPRTTSRYINELEALKLVGHHVCHSPDQ